MTQGAAARLWTAPRTDPPADPAAYFRLASAVIRRELIDLTRHPFGLDWAGANTARSAAHPPGRPPITDASLQKRLARLTAGEFEASGSPPPARLAVARHAMRYDPALGLAADVQA